MTSHYEPTIVWGLVGLVMTLFLWIMASIAGYRSFSKDAYSEDWWWLFIATMAFAVLGMLTFIYVLWNFKVIV